MSELTDFTADNTGPSVAGGIIKHVAGDALAEHDLVVFGPGGKAWPAQCIDYVAVADQAAVVLAETSVASQKVTTGLQRQPMLVSRTTGEVFVAAPNAGSTNGLTIYRYSATGSLLGSRQVSAVASVAVAPKLLELANGNVAVVYIHTADWRYAVYDSVLRQVQTPTLIDALHTSLGHDAVALSGGGFMVAWQPQATPQSQRLAVYSDAGAVVTAAATVQTWSGSTGNVMPRLHQLSSGNVVLAAGSGYTTTVGLYHAIFTALGASVLAFTNLSTVSAGQTTNLHIQIASMAGFYAISRPDGVNLQAFVLSNAGAVQGAPFAVADPTIVAWTVKLLSDGQQFWLLHGNYPAQTFWQLTKMPTTGTQYSTTQAMANAGAGSTSCIDSVFTRGRIVSVHTWGLPGQPMRWSIIDPANQRLEKDATAYGTTAAYAPQVFAGDDCSFVAAHDDVTATSLIAIKWHNIAVAGVADAAYAAGQLATLQPGAGAYFINTLRGPSTTKQFDHTTGTIVRANKGVVSVNGVVLKGM